MLEAITLAEIMLSQQPDTVGGGQGPKTGLEGQNAPAQSLEPFVPPQTATPPAPGINSGDTGVGGEKKEPKVAGLTGTLRH